jgi:hypothetical protein
LEEIIGLGLHETLAGLLCSKGDTSKHEFTLCASVGSYGRPSAYGKSRRSWQN